MSSRGFTYTLNNYKDVHLVKLRQIECVYHCFALETAPSTGTPHVQGYIYFKNARSLKKIAKDLFFNAHLEIVRGTHEHNRTYIFGPWAKGDKFKPPNPTAEEHGVMPIQGKRTDLCWVREHIQEGGTMRDLAAMATNPAQIRFAESLLKYLEVGRSWETQISWFWGRTGTGKSRTAHEELADGDLYRKTANSGKWWDGYDRHDSVIIDDIDKKFTTYKNLIDLLDRYEVRIETKQGTRQLVPKRVIITASVHPLEMFGDERHNAEELIRRLHEVREFR